MGEKTLRYLVILASFAFTLWVIYLLKPVVIPFVIAFFLAYLFSPLVDRLQHFGLSRWLSISVVFIGIGCVVFLAVWYLIPLIWEQLLIARDSIPVVIKWVNDDFLPWVSRTFDVDRMVVDTSHMSTIVMQYVQTNYNLDSIQSVLLRVAQSGLNVIQVGGVVVLIPIITFYFLLDWKRMLENFKRLIPRPYEQKTLYIVNECHSVLGAFVQGQVLVMLLLGMIYAIGLQIIGLDVGLIIGMVAGLASIIPYLGFAVGIIAAVIATLLQFGLDWMQLVLLLVVFMIGQAVEGYILQPFLLGDKIGLSPVAVVFAVLAGAQLAGFLGMLIALPVAAVIVVLLRHLRDCYEHSEMYGGQVKISIQSQVDGQNISIQTEQIGVNISVQDESIKSQQDAEKSSKIEINTPKDS